jgi:DNA-binding YbaB/EbfC family protein
MKNLGNMSKLMAQVQKMQDDMKKTQDELASTECDGQSGAGLVKISVNGQNRIVSLNIDSSLLKESEKEVLEDLIIAAFQDAKTKIDKLSNDEMSKITQGIALPPGFNLPF